MGLLDFAHQFPPSREGRQSSSAPRWIQLLPLLLLLPFLSTPLDRLLPKAVPPFIKSGLDECAALNSPQPSSLSSASRTKSDRFVPGTKAVLLINGTIWTGNLGGEEIIYEGSLLLENGLIKKVGTKLEVLKSLSRSARAEIKEIDLGGNWVTPGIVDAHSHIGVYASPGLNGATDVDSLRGAINPFLRSIDGLNTHDRSYNLSIAGGVTTSLVLPGSESSIGGQAFVIKPRETAENTPSSMVVEAPWIIDEEKGGMKRTGAIRHMKHALGENLHVSQGNNRLDQAYSLRQAYTAATAVKVKQDAWCAKGDANTQPFPEDLQWEALADVLRGNVKVQVHCYEAVDMDQLVRLTNEFKFSIAAVHHAHEAWLVPDLLKKVWGNTPAAAIYAFVGNYKREAFRGSEFAPRILSEVGIDVVMKSDHPGLDSRYLIFEAAQAHHYGLNASIALSSVTTTPAKIIGKDHRLGYLRDNYDADVVVWDAHPLSLGATPKQVWIDGIAQLDAPYFNPPKEANHQKLPVVPDFGDEAEIHKQARGDPNHAALLKKQITKNVIFTNVKEVFVKSGESLVSLVEEESSESNTVVVVVEDGRIVCSSSICLSTARPGFEVVDLKGGSIIPGLLSFGTPLGMAEIASEPSTQDGFVLDGLASGIAPILQNQIIRAADGASFATKDALIAARSGVTKGVTAPQSRGGFISGLSFVFSTSAATFLSAGAILQEIAALHVDIGHSSPYSISTQIGILRKLLFGKTPDEGGWWKKVRDGVIPLVVETHKADVIARLLVVKDEVESDTGKSLKLVISGGTEAHLIAASLAKANVGVVLTRARSFPSVWDQRRILPGPPLSSQTPVDALVSAGVLVGLGTSGFSSLARNTRLEAGWAFLGSSALTRRSALALVSINLEKLLGVKALEQENGGTRDWVAVEGDMFSFEGKVVAMGGG